MSSDLKAILSESATKSSSDRAVKRSKSHAYANSFSEALGKNGSVSIVEEPSASTNYFCVEIGGKQVAISPLASHEGWWDVPSAGFHAMHKRRGCEWGIVLLQLGKTYVDGFWISGKDWESGFGRYTKINLDNVERAERKGIARRFRNFDQFLELVAR